MNVTVNGRQMAADDPTQVILAIPHGTGELARAARTIYRMITTGASWTDCQGDTTVLMTPRDLIRLADILEGRPEPGEWRRVEGDHRGWEIGQLGDGSRHRLIMDQAVRTYGRKHVETVVLAGLPPLPEEAWEVRR